MTLVVDVGTNAEIVLGNRHRLLAASSPTGPAFEGAQISSGQRAAPGAIERVRIDRMTLEPRFRIIGVDQWSDVPDFADAVRRRGTGVTGICGSGIIEVVAELFLAGVITADGVIDGSMASRTPRIIADGRTFSYVLHEPAGGGDADGATGPRILITQNDVRAIQLAKAALYAGARLLMDQLEIDAVDEVRLAGAFGSQIDPLHAMVLGLIPDCDLGRVRAAGNAAGTGALIALLSGAARTEIEGVVRRVEKIETAVEPRFQEHFVEAMAIPHRTAASTNLERVVPLPARPAASERRGADRPLDRRRRRAALRPVPGDDTDRPDPEPSERGTRGAPRRPPRIAPRAHAVPDEDAGALRGPRRGGSVPDRAQRRHDPRGGRGRVPWRSRGHTPAAGCRCGCRRRARPVPTRDVPRHRAGDRAAPVHAVRAEPRERRRDRRRCTRSSRRTTAPRSSAISTRAGVTARSRTSGTS